MVVYDRGTLETATKAVDGRVHTRRWQGLQNARRVGCGDHQPVLIGRQHQSAGMLAVRLHGLLQYIGPPQVNHPDQRANHLALGAAYRHREAHQRRVQCNAHTRLAEGAFALLQCASHMFRGHETEPDALGSHRQRRYCQALCVGDKVAAIKEVAQARALRQKSLQLLWLAHHLGGDLRGSVFQVAQAGFQRAVDFAGVQGNRRQLLVAELFLKILAQGAFAQQGQRPDQEQQGGQRQNGNARLQ